MKSFIDCVFYPDRAKKQKPGCQHTHNMFLYLQQVITHYAMAHRFTSTIPQSADGTSTKYGLKSKLTMSNNNPKTHTVKPGGAIGVGSTLNTMHTHNQLIKNPCFRPQPQRSTHAQHSDSKISMRNKAVSKQGSQLSKSPSEFGLIHFRRTKNNTYCIISRLFEQKTLWSVSGGQITRSSKTNGRRKTHFTQRIIFKYALEKLGQFGFKYLVIHCRALTASKRYIFKNFFKRFRILLIKDFVSIAHNGCRSRNVRRL